jgi:hypothetical protein
VNGSRPLAGEALKRWWEISSPPHGLTTSPAILATKMASSPSVKTSSAVRSKPPLAKAELVG